MTVGAVDRTLRVSENYSVFYTDHKRPVQLAFYQETRNGLVPYDLTGKTPKLQSWRTGTPESLVFDEAMTILTDAEHLIDGVAAQASVMFDPGDTEYADGRMKAVVVDGATLLLWAQPWEYEVAAGGPTS